MMLRGAKGVNAVESDVTMAVPTEHYRDYPVSGIDGYLARERERERVRKTGRFSWWFASVTYRFLAPTFLIAASK